MKKLLITPLAAALLSLPLAATAMTTFTFNLSGAQEVPPVPSSAAGSFSMTLDDALDTITFTSVSLGLSAPVTMSHIHKAPAGASGPVVFDLLAAADFAGPVTIGPVVVPGSFSFTGADKAIDGSLLDAIIAKPWDYYINIHTSAYPGGELRGQLAPIPEPAEYLMLAMGLGVVGAVVRRRRLAATGA